MKIPELSNDDGHKGTCGILPDDDVILSKPWSPKYRNDYRIEPVAVGKKRFKTDDNSLILDIVREEGIEIN